MSKLAATHLAEFSHVQFAYRQAKVLSGANLAVDAGEAVVLTGANGAGKSTVARILLGELVPDAGSALLLGCPPDRFKEWARVGVVPQRAPSDYERFPATVLEAVRAGLYAKAGAFRPYRERHRRLALDAIGVVGLTGLERRQLGQLSGGQLQRVLLARALASKPDLLVCDEPTSSLDAESTEAFYGAVSRERARRGMAVFLITHDVARLRLTGGFRMLCLDGGVIHETCTERAAEGRRAQGA